VAVATLAGAGRRAIGERGRLGDAEVGELDVARRRHEHVRRADVAVHDRERAARRRAPPRHLADDVQRERRRHRTRLDVRREIAAVDVLEHDVVAAVGGAEPEHRDQVAMVKRAADHRLTDQRALEIGLVNQLRRDDLDRHPPLQTRCAVDRENTSAILPRPSKRTT
jgi:hypothetical protein